MSKTTARREDPESRRARKENVQLALALEESVETSCEDHRRDTVQDINELKTKLNSKTWHPDWSIVQKEKVLFFIIITVEPQPRMRCCVKINEELNLSVFFDDVELKSVSGTRLPVVVAGVNQVENIIQNIHCAFVEHLSGKQSVDNSLAAVEKVINHFGEMFPERHSALAFLKEQMVLTSKVSVTCYSWETIVFCSLVYSISPHAYKFIRSSGNLILPSPGTLRSVCSKLNTDPQREQNENFLNYVKRKFPFLAQKDKLVLLLMDEVYVKPQMDYKQGTVVGSAADKNELAKTAYVFMISSLLSSLKDVVHILPVANADGIQLCSMVKRIVIGLEDIGFTVLAIVADNSAVNRKAISHLCDPPELKTQYVHPKDPSRKLFFVIDPVHILKCVRNSWLNVAEQELIFPEFEGTATAVASFGALKSIHSIEKNQLVKYGVSLSLKALYPSHLERQNVSLALRIFNECIPEALRKLGPLHNINHCYSTASFIEIICKWWDVLNVKTLWKGKRLRNPLQEPMTRNSPHLVFLQEFVQWLKKWKELNVGNKLTKETHFALCHSTEAIIQMSNHCLNDCGHSFFLPGKVQTDSLEARFGQYRQLAGSNYNISVRQIFEVEKKIRIRGMMALSDPAIFSACEDSDETDVSEFNSCVVDKNDVNEISDEMWPLIYYIAGYCSYSCNKWLTCSYCTEFLTVKSDTRDNMSCYSLIAAADRGGLCYPSDDVVLCASYVYAVMNILLEQFRVQFLQRQNQRSVLKILAGRCLPNIFLGHCCPAHSASVIKGRIVHIASNIVLNNFVKNETDQVRSKTMPAVKRKR